MTPVPYVAGLHFDQVQAWVQSRGDVITPDALPQTGFIIPGKAAGFLYRTDSSLAWIEGLVAAPGLEREERSQAVDAVVAALIDAAPRLGVKTLMAYTLLDAVVKRSERFGFTYVSGGFHLIARAV
jgi:hypothetical protein